MIGGNIKKEVLKRENRYRFYNENNKLIKEEFYYKDIDTGVERSQPYFVNFITYDEKNNSYEESTYYAKNKGRKLRSIFKKNGVYHNDNGPAMICYGAESENFKLFCKYYKDGFIYRDLGPYSFKIMREKVKELGLEYTPRQYLFQIVAFAGLAGGISYLYFYNLLISIVYAIIAVSFIPYITYLRCKRQYSEYIFEQVQVYCTNTIMEFATTQAFVKSLEGVVASGILEEPILSDVKTMIALSYEKGDVYDSIKYMDTKYPYYMVKNMHQLFLQVTKEGAKDTQETFENMLSDIDILVEGVYRDRTDRANFHKQFLTFGVALYGLIALIQILISQETYIAMLDNIIVRLLVHGIVIINSCFLLAGEKYYNENVGAE